VRGRIEAILDYAATRAWRTGENPARWRGHLDKLLPARGKVRAVEHHAALPWGETAAFMADLRDRDGMGARALEFAILTAARSGEVRGATWAEIDLAAALWAIPAERMKAGREHRVPLPDAAVALLRGLAGDTPKPTGLVFPGSGGKPLSNMSLTAVLRRMDRGDLTAHGFRSTFRDWAAESTMCEPDVVEMALAHTVSNKVEAAYRRGDLFEKRRKLMADWAAFCRRGVAPVTAA
jgi:integrase